MLFDVVLYICVVGDGEVILLIRLFVIELLGNYKFFWLRNKIIFWDMSLYKYFFNFDERLF